MFRYESPDFSLARILCWVALNPLKYPFANHPLALALLGCLAEPRAAEVAVKDSRGLSRGSEEKPALHCSQVVGWAVGEQSRSWG
jgi:hypothetical protein